MIIIVMLLIAVPAIAGAVFVKKPILRVVFAVIAAAGLLLAYRLGSLYYSAHYRINLVDTSISPNGIYELSFQQIGDPDFPFGYTHARLVLKKGSRTVVKRSFDIADDGANAGVNNWSVKWKETCAEVIIYGSEQQEVLYILNFDGTDEIGSDISAIINDA